MRKRLDTSVRIIDVQSLKYSERHSFTLKDIMRISGQNADNSFFLLAGAGIAYFIYRKLKKKRGG